MNRVRLVTILMSLAITSCSSNFAPQARDVRSITVLLWVPGETFSLDQSITQEFTKQTGISVRLVPGPESVSQRLTQERTILAQPHSTVDVLQVDTTWPSLLGDQLLDLNRSVRKEMYGAIPELWHNATIAGRVVAVPFYAEYGLLYYRSDLLKKYGFSAPPRTWTELEIQAARIQQGERSNGRTDFWGYVWQGADYEGLTCNALEWQASAGGGNIVEPDKRVHVDNAPTVAAFARAAQWVGTISPPGVTEYLEEDSRNLWQSGRAAFMRNWSSRYTLARRSRQVARGSQ